MLLVYPNVSKTFTHMAKKLILWDLIVYSITFRDSDLNGNLKSVVFWKITAEHHPENSSFHWQFDQMQLLSIYLSTFLFLFIPKWMQTHRQLTMFSVQMFFPNLLNHPQTEGYSKIVFRAFVERNFLDPSRLLVRRFLVRAGGLLRERLEKLSFGVLLR